MHLLLQEWMPLHSERRRLMIQSKPQETSEISSRGTLIHRFPLSAPLESIHKLNKRVPALHMTCLHYTTMAIMFRIKCHKECIYVHILQLMTEKIKGWHYLNKSLRQICDTMGNNVRGCPEKSSVPMFIECGPLKHA